MFYFKDKKSKGKNLNSFRGAGLIEVMVSLLILGVGLMGVLSLQANGLNSNQRALFVTESQILAQDMADRIQAFGSTIWVGNIGNLYDAIDVSKLVPNTVTVPSCAAGCDPDAGGILAFDVAEWQSAISDSSLPRGRGTVTLNGDYYDIRVMWDQNRLGGAGVVGCATDNCFTMQVRVAL